MSIPAITRHARIRMQQRGIRSKDLALMTRFATEIEDRLFMSNSDVEKAITQLKSMIQSVERLRGKAFAIGEGGICTAFHCRKQTEIQLLRRRRNGK